LWGLQRAEFNTYSDPGVQAYLKDKGRSTLTSKEYALFNEPSAKAGSAGLAVASLFIPGPEDVALGAFALTKVGKVVSKFADEIFDGVKGLFKGGDEVDLPTVEFSKTETPNITKNIEEAVEQGKPDILTRETNKSQIRKNRREALKGEEAAKEGQSLDEFPFASTKEGGSGANVKGVPTKEQNVQGGKLSQFYQRNDIQNGDKFKVKIVE